MSERERRTLLGVACFLLFASLVRHGMERRTVAVELPEDPSRLPVLEAESQAALDDREARSRPLGADERIDLNRAPEVDLNRLHGVGRTTAAAIVREREKGGPFASVDDLTRVRGIGPASVERLRPHVEVSGAAGGGRGANPGVGTGLGGSPLGPSGVTGSRAVGLAAAGHADGWTPVDLNRASEAELTRLPGVGPAIAGRIVRTRAERGGFGRVDDLLEVSGIGPATLERLRPLVMAAR